MKIYNTLSRTVEEFTPIHPPKVGMYTCGPTVYDHMHVGNLRTFVLSDVLKRVLEDNKYSVTAVQNITDIDDKIIKRAKDQNTSIEEIAQKFTDFFIKDAEALHINVSKENQPKATEYVGAMIKYIQLLIEKGFAYVEKDGSVYFDISKFPEYGKLTRIEKKNLKTGTRVLSDNYEKDDIQDFVLWKVIDDDGTKRFESPWGFGRPGWHIECSAMSQILLGEQFDIHVGGVDLIFPHHENEIAQSEAASGKSPFVKYWVHGAHMLVDGKKMSKSLNNFFTIGDIMEKGFDPIALRYLYFQTHYRKELNFTWEALEAAQKALSRLYAEFLSYGEAKIGCAEFEEKFHLAVTDDLNMPQALAVMWEMIASDNAKSAKAASLLKMNAVLGFGLKQQKIKKEEELIPSDVQKLVDERETLRKEKRFHLSDQIRNKIKKLGYDVLDQDNKTVIKKITP